MSTIEMIKYNIDAARDKVDFALTDDKMKELMKTEEKFDVLVLDAHMNDALLGLGEILKLPVVAFGSAGSNRYTDEMVKNPTNPTYNPITLLGFSDIMNFHERLINAAVTLYEMFAYQ